MTREEAVKWLKAISTKTVVFGWDDYALQESQKEIRERCEKAFGEAIDMAIEALQTEDKPSKVIAEVKVDTDEIVKRIKEEYVFADEVVRCKECRHYQKVSWVKEMRCVNPYWATARGTVETDFCSYGERREPDKCE